MTRQSTTTHRSPATSAAQTSAAQISEAQILEAQILEAKASKRDFAHAICDGLELFHVCPAGKCRRSRVCRGEPEQCLERHAGFFSRELEEWIAAVRDGRDDGLSVDDALDRAEPHVDALVTWVLALNCGLAVRRVPR